MDPREVALIAANALDDKKGVNILVLNVGGLTVLCDYFVIASGRSTNQVRSLIEAVDEKLSAQGITPRRTEGVNEGRWAVLDYGNVMVHLFHREERAYYGLDRLWNDGSNALDLPFDQSVPD